MKRSAYNILSLEVEKEEENQNKRRGFQIIGRMCMLQLKFCYVILLMIQVSGSLSKVQKICIKLHLFYERIYNLALYGQIIRLCNFV